MALVKPMPCIPNDIIWLIFELLYDEDPRNLIPVTSVCKLWNTMAEPLLYRTLDLVNGRPLDRVAKLNRFAGIKKPDLSRFLRHTRHLKIPQDGLVSDRTGVLSQLISRLDNLWEITYCDRGGDDEWALKSLAERCPDARINLEYRLLSEQNNLTELVKTKLYAKIHAFYMELGQPGRLRHGDFACVIKLFPNLKHFECRSHGKGIYEELFDLVAKHAALSRIASKPIKTNQNQFPRLESFKMTNCPQCPTFFIHPAFIRERMLTALTTLSIGSLEHLQIFLSTTQNLRRLGLSRAGASLHQVWNTCIDAFPLLEDLRLWGLQESTVQKDFGRPLLSSTSTLKTLMLDTPTADRDFGDWDWSKLPVSCPRLRVLGMPVTGRAGACKWVATFLGAFSDLKKLVVFFTHNHRRWDSSRSVPPLYYCGSSISQSCKAVDFIQQHKVGYALEDLIFPYEPDEGRRSIPFNDQAKHLGFPGLRYAIAADGMLEAFENDFDESAACDKETRIFTSREFLDDWGSKLKQGSKMAEKTLGHVDIARCIT